MAADRWREEIFARWNSWPGDDARETIGRVSHQPDFARQLDLRSTAGRKAAASAQRCPTLARRRNGHRRINRQAIGGETQFGSELLALPCAHRSLRLCAGEI